MHVWPSASACDVRDRGGRRRADLFGHPRGLTYLFTTEMWERFSYYGMRSLLVLYMTKYLLLADHSGNVVGLLGLKRGLESIFGPLDVQPLSSQIWGLYTGLVYFTPIFGGLLADRVLGQRRTVVIGAVLMAIGHFMMAVEQLFLFALLALILGTGCFKPNISTQVGGLYAPGDQRRDRAYSIFYVGINVGAFLAPLVCGTLGEEVGWHYGFAAAGVGMCIGLCIYLYALPHLPQDELHKAKAAHSRAPAAEPRRMARHRRAAGAVRAQYVVLGLLRADRQHHDPVDRRQCRPQHRSVRMDGADTDDLVSRLQSVHDLCLHAVCRRAVGAAGGARHRAVDRHQDGARLFRRHRGQSHQGLCRRFTPATARRAGSGCSRSIAIITVGELYLSPVGLSLVTKVAPARILSMMMGIWLATSFTGGFLAGYIGSFWSRMPHIEFFLMIAGIAACAGLMILACHRPLKGALGE